MKKFIRSVFKTTFEAAVIIGISLWIGVGVGHGFVTGMRWAL